MKTEMRLELNKDEIQKLCNFANDLADHSRKIIRDFRITGFGISEKIDKVVEYTPSDAVTVNIGLHKAAARQFFIDWPLNEPYDPLLYAETFLNEHVCVYKNNINPCSLSYIVRGDKPRTRDFFSTFHTNDGAIDHLLNHFHKNNNIFYGSRYVLTTGNSNFKSTVFFDPLSVMSFDEYLLSYQQSIDDDDDD